MNLAIIAYVPVLHRGYVDFFWRYKHAGAKLWLLNEDVIQELAMEFPELSYLVKKDALRAVAPPLMRNALAALVYSVDVLHVADIPEMAKRYSEFSMPDEDVMRRFSERYLPGRNTTFAQVFLRWHRDNAETEEEVRPDRVVALSDFEKECMERAFREGARSADWWRQVGGIIVKSGEVLLVAHNAHVPFPEMPYVYGDPRSMWSKGVRIELTTAEHVESMLVAEAAKRGISLWDADLYLTDFPCPPCAKLIAHAGFKRLYFSKGSYAMLQGESIVRSRGVEVVRVIV